MLRSRRWALTSLGTLLFGALLVPSLASAKKRKKPKKKAPEPEQPPPAAAGEALKDAQLVKREDHWYLKNESRSQRIIVALRVKQPGSTVLSIDAYVLEPGQEVVVAGATNKPILATARYDG